MGSNPLARGLVVGVLVAGAGAVTAMASPWVPPAAPAHRDEARHDDGDGHHHQEHRPRPQTTTTAPASTPTPADPVPAPASTTAPAVPVDPAPAQDPAPTPAAPAAVAPPELGKSVAVAPVQGVILVRAAPGAPVQPLSAGAALPTGAHVDARHGTVDLVTAVDAAGHTQKGRFHGALFAVHQSRTGHGMTTLIVGRKEFRVCARSTRAVAGATASAARHHRRKPVRRLWGSDSNGRFRTSGRGSVATVRGTHWLTQDSCAGTLTTVSRGAVAVHDNGTGHTVIVRAGHSYFASVR